LEQQTQLLAATKFYRIVDAATGKRYRSSILPRLSRSYWKLANVEARSGNRLAAMWYAFQALRLNPRKSHINFLLRLTFTSKLVHQAPGEA
jgi:hypothetical protein